MHCMVCRQSFCAIPVTLSLRTSLHSVSPPKRNLFCLPADPGLPIQDVYGFILPPLGAGVVIIVNNCKDIISYPSVFQPESCTIFILDDAREYL